MLTLQKENNKLRAKLEEMRYVSRAKFLLISEQGMTEEAAHRYIEKAPWTPGAPERSVPGSYRKIRINIVWKTKNRSGKKKLSAAVLFL
ncbi:MAG: ANTAR domain-containing protein [Ruminococcus callidus]